MLYPVQLRDLTGREYPHFVQGISVPWYQFPANYAFGRLVPEIGGGGSCIILYLGEAEDMSTRMPHHDRLHEALVDHGATHALYHPNFGGEEARRAGVRALPGPRAPAPPGPRQEARQQAHRHRPGAVPRRGPGRDQASG